MFTGHLAEVLQSLVSGIWWNFWNRFAVLLHDGAKRKRKKMPGIRGGEGFITLSSSQLLINSLFSPGKKKCVGRANTA